MRILDSTIDCTTILRDAENPGAGAIVQFQGTVRSQNQNKAVIALEYEAEKNLAEKLIQAIEREAVKRFGLIHAFCAHRVGRLEVGEVAVIVVTAAAHRREAYAGNEYILNRVKHEVPIWKKEHFADGDSTWSAGCQGCTSVEHHLESA